jgi:small subunit ribosomal protein S8e
MVLLQHRSGRKSTGGAYKRQSVRRQHMMGSRPTLTTLGATRGVKSSALGGHVKQRLLAAQTANVYDPKTKKHSQAKITTIVDNPANRNYARRNIMTKGAVIETSAGRARITNSPGQEGQVNAVILHE